VFVSGIFHQTKFIMMLQEYEISNSPAPSEIKRASLVNELQSVWQPLRLISQFHRLVKIKKGNGERVMLFPGWKSHETVMFPMKKYLERLGYKAEYWGLGFNNGQVEIDRDRIIENLMQEDSDEKLSLVGWSLGGLIAREVARELPERIASVATYGTPVIGGPKYTIGKNYYGEEVSKQIHDQLAELDNTNPIQVPMTIIFTKNDSIVNWSACLDYTSKNVKHYEVKSTQFSLGIDPEVWRLVGWHLQGVSSSTVVNL